MADSKGNGRRISTGRVAVLIALFAALYWWSTRPVESRLDWRHDFDQASAEAKTCGLPILAKFGADWCGPCRNLEARVFTADAVVAAIESGCIPLHVDLTDGSSANPHVRIADRYGITSVPEVLLIDPTDGSVLARARPEDLTVEGVVAFIQKHERDVTRR